MKVYLVTPNVWSAALVPKLKSASIDVELRENLPGFSVATGPAVHVVHADSSRYAPLQVAEWMLGRNSAEPAADNQRQYPEMIAVVGSGALRFEWQFRELGAVAIAGHVWQARLLVQTIRRFQGRLPSPDPAQRALAEAIALLK